jgi:hypothetical protein
MKHTFLFVQVNFQFCGQLLLKLWRSLLRQCAARREVPVSTAGRVIGNFQVAYSFCPHSVALGFTEPKEFFLLGCEVWPALRSANSTVLVVPNFRSKDGIPT